MIISNLVGGLSNQMFQYVSGRSTSLRCGQPLRLATDHFDGYTLHNGFELHRLFAFSDDPDWVDAHLCTELLR
jgi:hypothetical protein